MPIPPLLSRSGLLLPLSTQATLYPLWAPLRVGNGRLLVTGNLHAPGIHDTIEWRLTVNGEVGDWEVGYTPDPDYTGDFEFWVSPLAKDLLYRLEIKGVLDVTETDLLDETFIWHLEVHAVEERFRNLYLPDLLREDPLAVGLYDVNAKAMADITAQAEDCALQAVPSKATWGISYWEEQLGLPTYLELPLAIRREAVLAHRSLTNEGARTFFFNTLEQLVGENGYVSVENYNLYAVNLNFSAESTSELLRTLELLVDKLKPVGIDVTVTAGGFIVDVSELDIDTL